MDKVGENARRAAFDLRGAGCKDRQAGGYTYRVDLEVVAGTAEVARRRCSNGRRHAGCELVQVLGSRLSPFQGTFCPRRRPHRPAQRAHRV